VAILEFLVILVIVDTLDLAVYPDTAAIAELVATVVILVIQGLVEQVVTVVIVAILATPVTQEFLDTAAIVE